MADNGERLVDLRTECPEISFEIADCLTQPEEVKEAHFVRESIAQMIIKRLIIEPLYLFKPKVYNLATGGLI